ncbi:hypothetical protein FKR81_22335 [Lentzea tibetensis]|uniref:Uncharacterized protein n=1 Tax=Lentzea tibetensis TaxID=2591470 RepID=A0A563ER16_9PSEU|nr:IniB N-terminal domain-containing protein [Lentzea tibetensis]TWP49972.1 hypothetical protein FKR81_22335 [Lentzea tibetensis]
MTTSPSTIHDFVLNLLTDPSAKAAFDIDAQGALEQAGLSDISAVDVQEVIPLVLDTLPAANGLPAVDGLALDGFAFEGLPETVLESGTAGAISQLQAVASQLTSSGLSLGDLNTSSAGVLAADEQGLTVWGGNETLGTYGAGSATIAGDFSFVDDVFGITSTATTPVADTTLGTLDTATATVDSTAHTATSLVPGADSLLGTVNLGAVDTVNGIVHSAVGALGGGDASVTSALDVTSLGQNANGNVEIYSDDTVGNLVGTATGVVDQAGVGGVLDTANGVAHSAGAGSVVSNVTDVAGDAVDGLGVTDLLF